MNLQTVKPSFEAIESLALGRIVGGSRPQLSSALVQLVQVVPVHVTRQPCNALGTYHQFLARTWLHVDVPQLIA